MAKNKHGFLKLAIVGAVVAVLGVGVYHGIKHQDKIKDAWNNLWGIEEQVPEEKPTPDDPTGGEEQPLVNSVTIEVEGQDPTTQSVASGGLMEEPEAPTKEGYIFQGWALKGTTEPIDFSTFIVESDITLVPLWLEEPVKVTSATQFTFDGEMLTGYSGTDTNVVIPSSYSLGEVVTKTISIETFDDLMTVFFDNDENPMTVIDCNGNPQEVTHYNIFESESTLAFPLTAEVNVQTYVDGEDFTVTEIYSDAFKDNLLIEKVTVPSKIAIIGGQAFVGCINLQEVIIEEGVSKICGGAFGNCESLKRVTIPASVNSFNGNSNPFDGCTSLENIVVSAENEVFDSRENCNALIETATNILFAGCKSTIIPQGVTTIKGDSFEGITGLKEVVIPTTMTEIGDLAFYNCKGLTSITIPNSVTRIGICAFERCENLTKLVLPNSITELANCCFQGMPSNLEVVLEGKTPPAIDTSLNHSTLIIYVPDDAVDTFKEALNDYADQIKPVSEYEEA